MRVLVIIDSFYTGGAEISTLQYLSFLQSQGHTVSICKLQNRKPEYDPGQYSLTDSVKTFRSSSFIKQIFSITAEIRKFKPDIVHSVLFKSRLRTRFSKLFISFCHVESLVSCPYEPIRYADPRVNRFGFFFFKFIDKLTSKFGANYFLAISDAVKKHYEDNLGIKSKQIHVIYRGREANVNNLHKQQVSGEVRQSLNIDNDKIVLINVGRQEYPKGHLILLQALAELYHRKPDILNKIQVLFCGRNGNATPDIEAFIRNNEFLNSTIKFLGHRSDISRLLVASDIFVFPSISEGLGGALIEAQASGLPIICTDLPVFHEVVIPMINALVFPMNNILELYRVIVELVSREDVRVKMGVESLKNFEGKFEISKINNKTYDYYKSILKE